MKFDINKGYCCETMGEVTRYLPDKNADINDLPLKYNPSMRSFAILYCPLDIQHQGSDIKIALPITNCPWCGARLPKKLANLREKILYEEYNVDHVICNENPKCYPEEFDTEEWWKKRGL